MKLIAKGNSAEIYKQNENKICKLFYKNYPKQLVEHEFNNAKIIYQLGINTPFAYDIVFIEERYGIIYEKLNGTTLLSKINTENTNVDFWIEKFVNFHKDFLKYQSYVLINYKDFLKLFASESVDLIKKIDNLQDGNFVLHGDFHPENVIVDNKSNLFLIDMMNVCKGPMIYDIARTYFLLGYNPIFQERYLSLMGCNIEEIKPYLEVISLVRENEMMN